MFFAEIALHAGNRVSLFTTQDWIQLLPLRVRGRSKNRNFPRVVVAFLSFAGLEQNATDAGLDGTLQRSAQSGTGGEGKAYCQDEIPVDGVPFPWVYVVPEVGVCCEGMAVTRV